ncbi:MAG TPA: hypothetical protein VLQ91_12625, partial [Draconibacterium sp.]|nr:hypothetical protein [Draconibacterium sp.]
ETALSNSGRGRFPSFLMEHKALAVEKGIYKYDKAYNGSYKNYVPDHYQLGYYLVGKSREKYGADLWNSVLNRVGRKPFSLTPFNKALKEKTGFNKVQLYNSVFETLKNEWIEEDKNFMTNDFEIVSPENKTYSEYKYNHWLNDSTIISYKTGLNEVPSFVKIDMAGNEKKIEVPGIIFNESVNYLNEWIVWSEQIPNPRWQHSGSSYIRLQNIENNQKKTIFPEFTAFSPSISPEWINEKEVVVIVLLPEGKRLAKIDLETNHFEIIQDKDLGELKNLRVRNNNLYFVGTYSGKNCLYRMNLDDKSVFQIYESRFGIESTAFSPTGEGLVLSDYTSNGFRLIKIDVDKLHDVEMSNIEKRNYSLADEMSKQEPGVLDFSESDTMKYKSKRYSKIKNLLNFHSWAPAVVNADSYEITPGVSIVSQNKLGTAMLNVGYEWSIPEKTGSFYGKYTFKGWYPVFDFELSSGNSASEYAVIEQTKNSSGQIIKQDTVLKRFTWSDTNFGADIRVPMDFSRRKFMRLLQPEIKYELTSYKHNSSTPEKFYEGSFQSFTYRFYYQQLLRKSLQDVYPNFGFVVDGLYRNSPFGETDLGNLSLGQSYLYIPGILSNHGIRFYGGVQDKNNTGKISFSDMIRYPRGWGKINTNEMISFASDYKFPVFYPEWSLGGLVYLQRVNASIYADYAYFTANIYKDGEVVDTFNKSIQSFGIELTGDANFFRFYAPVEIGFRASYLPEMQNVYFDFLFSIDFNSL